MGVAGTGTIRPISLGVRANLPQFLLLVGVNGLVGALVGQERTLVPLIGERIFGVSSATAALAFIVTFGLTKAVSNLVAGALSDRIGRKPILLAGWLIGIPVPLMLMWAPSWAWVVAANALLGVNQGLTWSITVVMKIDLAGPSRRGLAMGLNEFAGYLAVAFSAVFSGYLASRYGLRPEPLFFGLAVAGLGLALSALLVRETADHARSEIGDEEKWKLRQILGTVSYKHRGLAAICRTGLINNANDAYVWGLLPLLMSRGRLSTSDIGIVVALYPAVWGVGQLATGALSDRLGRRGLISAGMLLQALALAWFIRADGLFDWAAGAFLLGTGTALAYPVLLAAVGDLASASWRGGAVGVYRTWRDFGYVVGALGGGIVADLFGLRSALGVIALLTAFAGVDIWRNLSSSFKR